MSDITFEEYMMQMANENNKLRAERDEQKRRADYLSKDFDRDIKMYQAEVAELRANLAAARGLLREAREWAEQTHNYSLESRIDATLKGDGECRKSGLDAPKQPKPN